MTGSRGEDYFGEVVIWVYLFGIAWIIERCLIWNGAAAENRVLGLEDAAGI